MRPHSTKKSPAPNGEGLLVIYDGGSVHLEVEGLEVLVERGGTVEDLVTAGLHGEFVDGFVVVFEGLCVEANHGLLCLTRFQREFLEALQRLDGGSGVVEGLHVDLYGLGAFAVAGIGDGDHDYAEGLLGISLGRLGGDLALADGEGGVGESVAEGVLRLTLEVTVGAVLHRVVEEIGQVVVRAIEGDGQFAAWVVVAEEHFCKGLGTALTGIPGLEQGIVFALDTAEGDGRAGAVDEDDGLARGVHGADEHLLHLRQFDVGRRRLRPPSGQRCRR